MSTRTLLKANLKQHKGTMAGIFIIMLLVSLTMVSVLTIWLNTNTYLHEEMQRMQYGDITIWTQNLSDPDQLRAEIKHLEAVEAVEIQPLIYSDYTIQDTVSDSEGQMIVYEPKQYPYRIFQEDTNGYRQDVTTVHAKEIYISPSLTSTFDVKIGDEIAFMIGRQGLRKAFTVAGMFEDPFMGSSMIGMKSFLISQTDYDDITDMISHAGMDALARSGQMFHVQQSTNSRLTNDQLNQLLNEHTCVQEYQVFVHSAEAITGFMLTLQNAFTALFQVFACILFLVSVIIVGYSINASLQQDQVNMGILKTIGYDGKQLRNIWMLQYLFTILTGTLTGMLLSLLSVPLISREMVSFAGILTPAQMQSGIWALIFLVTGLLFYGFLYWKTRGICRLLPISILQEQSDFEPQKHMQSGFALRKQRLLLSISLRQLLSGKQRYISVGITAILLVCITSMVGRMNSWLGPDGKGMMDAFHPAELDLGVQLLGKHDQKEMESIIEAYSAITDTYALAMPSVAINGVDITANVITEPQRFHIRKGKTIQHDDEIVITETIAADRKLSIHDRVTVSAGGNSAVYTIAGIYQCADDMGANIGMSREGYLRIGNENREFWCHHYFLDDATRKQVITDALNKTYGGDIFVHENAWPGLYSIISAMHMLLFIMYLVTAIFILIVTVMTGNKIFLSEKRDVSIYKALGFTSSQLRTTFAIRYGVTALIGSMIGTVMSILFGDTLIAALMKLYGISSFVAHPGLITISMPGIAVSALFALFAYFASVKIKHLDMRELIAE